MRIAITVVALAMLGGPVQSAETKFDLTGENAKVTFVGTKPDGKHEGGFKTLTGSAVLSGADATSLKITVDIDMDSTFSDNRNLTGHLKSPDFFDVKNHPKAKFISAKVEKAGDNYTVTGTLSLCGKTKEVKFPAKIEVTDTALNLTSEFKINRNDWGISYGRGKISDDVNLALKVNAKKK